MWNRCFFVFSIFITVFFLSFPYSFPALALEADTRVPGTAAGSGEVTATTGSPKNVAVVSPKEFIFGSIQFLCMALIVYFLMVINPTKAKDEGHKQFMENLKKNDEVFTSTGLYGKVVSISPDQIGIEIAPNVKVRFDPKYIHPLPKATANAK